MFLLLRCTCELLGTFARAKEHPMWDRHKTWQPRAYMRLQLARCRGVIWHDTWHPNALPALSPPSPLALPLPTSLSLSPPCSVEIVRRLSISLALLSLLNMVAVRCSDSTLRVSPASSSSSSSLSAAVAAAAAAAAAAGRFRGEDLECGGDRMERMEMEAAEVLAGMARSGTRQGVTSSCESGGKWGSKGKRASPRVKTRSPPADSGNTPNCSAPRCSDLSVCRAVVDQFQFTKMSANSMTKSVKEEQDIELTKPPLTITTNYAPFGGGRSKQNSSEAEKEARRLRRVLANRESARQTIRRRQALCEELTRKAADLERENENLKKEKNLAVKVYETLKSTNEHLKAQVAKTMKAEVDETSEELSPSAVQVAKTIKAEVEEASEEFKLAPVELSAYSSTLSHKNSQLTPFPWPPVSQSPTSVQPWDGLQNSTAVSSEVPVPTLCKSELCQEQKSQLSVNGPRTPLYVLPCPWYFHHPEIRSGLYTPPPSSPKDKDETSVNNQHIASSSSKITTHIENPHSSLSMNIKTEVSNSLEAKPSSNLQEIPFGFLPDGGGHYMVPHPGGMVLMAAPLSSVRPPVSACHKNGLQAGSLALSSSMSHFVSALPKRNQETTTMYPNKKLVDAIAAAEARRRRKEVTKLKNIHGRQFRTNC
ncbi:uncharacterized protein LOC131166872 [Malania oleifera]|uniref:uncharacterized protein LOC131166872 n=1 Tax=Malania oleifera TaxID=397392 RepID=UPI0025ADBB30|nr:uncharacterized protein LOC131166872 [Malania oleifera]